MTSAYFAGLFDGEGCVFIATRPPRDGGSKSYQLIATIQMADGGPLRILHSKYGGTLRVVARDVGFDLLMWRVSSLKAAIFLRDILPHVLIKRSQIEMGLAFQEVLQGPRKGRYGGARRLTEDELRIREAFRCDLSALKKEHVL